MKLASILAMDRLSAQKGWIGVDLDGTLAEYDGWKDGQIGKPIPAMVARVKKWIAAGQTVKIFTARIDGAPEQVAAIRAWTKKYIGTELEVTNVKTAGMIELWDDRAIQVEKNTGLRVGVD